MSVEWRGIEPRMREMAPGLRLIALVLVGPALLAPAWADVEGGPQAPLASVGLPAPDFALPDTEALAVSLSDYEGLVRLVAFLVPGVAVCDLQAQALNETLLGYRSQGLVVLAISTQGEAECRRAYRERLSLGYPVLGISAAVDAAYGHPSYLPTTFLIGRDGLLLATYEGYTDSWAIAADLQEPLARRLPIEEGARAPNFGVCDIFGRKTALNQFRGQWAVLLFLPTLAEAGPFRLVEKLTENVFFSRQGEIVVILFTADEAEPLAVAAGGLALPPRLVSDPWQLMFGVYRATEPGEGKPRPAVFLVDVEGTVRLAAYGAQVLDVDVVLGLAQGLLAASASAQPEGE